MDEVKCEICDGTRQGSSILCESCNGERMAAASFARIMAGTGLTYSNCEAYSEENYVKMVKGDDNGEG